MSATLNVIYPVGHKFDLDYYLKTHMPLVSETWGPVGLKSWEIFELTESSGYQIQAVLRWDSLESWEKAPKDKVLGDIPNFTAAQPLMLTGNSKASVVI